MSAILHHIKSLEDYAERHGARLVRDVLPEPLHARLLSDRITVRPDLSPEQHLMALVHELAHWLAHAESPPPSLSRCTIYEYEAEAVEALIMARLGLEPPQRGPASVGQDAPTDGLLSSSLDRVRSTTQRLCQALGLD